MRKTWKNLILGLVAVLIVFEPYLVVYGNYRVKAEDEEIVDEEPLSDAPYDGDSTVAQPASLAEFKYNIKIDKPVLPSNFASVYDSLRTLNTAEDQSAGIGLDESISAIDNPRIVLNPDDRQALINLYRLSASIYMPDFDTEPSAIFTYIDRIRAKLPDDVRAQINISSEADILNLKVEKPALFADLVHAAQEVYAEEYDSEDAKALIMSDPAAINDFTGRDIDEIADILSGYNQDSDADKKAEYVSKYEELKSEVEAAIDSIKIDIRVLKMMVYLVTPKTQGGAGHWRIKVKRILSGYTSPKRQTTRESDATYEALNEESETNSTITDVTAPTGGTTAADIGRSAGSASIVPISYDNDSADQFATVYDDNGESYNAFVNLAKAADSSTSTDEEYEKNLSAHADGQAIDIAEIDDIRCTLIKKKRIGKPKKSKYSQRPIKLAWQTTKGYSDDTTSSDYEDTAAMLRSAAADGITDLITEFGGDISDYNGDLSAASFSDIATLLGQSIFTQVLNSSGANLSGYSFGDTLKELGQMYFADYFGLPRDLFINHNYDNYQDIEIAIGAAAVEQRMSLPIGTFGGTDLNDMLRHIGQRRIEYELNLDTGDLDPYFNGTNLTNVSDRNYIVGKAVIEKELNLQKGSYSGDNNTAPANFADLKNAIGKYKADIMFRDPNYVDSTLHLEMDTTEKLKSDQMSPLEYATLVGRIRLDDAAWGFQYLSSKDSSFEVPSGTFERIINGDSNALVDLGIVIISRNFAETQDERQALAQWVRTNKDSDQCAITDPVKVPINAGTTNAKEVTISERKAIAAGLLPGDMFALLGCKKSNAGGVFQKIGSKAIYVTILEQYLNSDDKVKFNLTETNPTFSSSDPEKQFYISRAYKIVTLLDRIESNWKNPGNDPQYIAMKRVIDDATANIKNVVNNSMPIVTIDQAKAVGRSIAVSVNKLSSDVNALEDGTNRYINKVNGTVFDISELLRTVAEIIKGETISSTDNLTIDQIPEFTFNLSTGSLATLNISGTKTSQTTTSTLMLLFARKINPKDFFVSLAASKVEDALELPVNSLTYFVNNYEKKGLGTVDSFYTAIGQAKIEETFNLPSNYFAGPLITDSLLDMPDFRTDLRALYLYGDKDIEVLAPKYTQGGGEMLKKNALGVENAQALNNETLSFDQVSFGFKNVVNGLGSETLDYGKYFETDGTTKTGLSAEDQAQVDAIVEEEHWIESLNWIKISDPSTFNYLVARAEGRYRDQMEQFLGSLSLENRELEVNIYDVVENVRLHKLNDRIRSPEQDVLTRLGLSGSIDSLAGNGAVAWATADTRAKDIDKLLGLATGSTRAFITGRVIAGNNAKNKLNTNEKQLLVARMGISPTALDKFIQVLNKEIPDTALDEKALDVTNVGDNPYIKYASSDACQVTLENIGGTLSSQQLVKNSYFYFDADSTATNVHTFGNKKTAENYIRDHPEKTVDYWTELASGFSALTGGDKNQIINDLKNYIKDDNATTFLGLDDNAYNAIFKATGVGKETLEKLQKGESDYNRPLVAYKKAVGYKVVKKTITSKIFAQLGINIDPDVLTGNEFFEILSGNYQPLWALAGNIIDDNLGIPSGSAYAVLTASSSRERECALAEVGGSILGRFLGFDYISMRGNIYENIGRSNLEKTLGLPRNTFSGGNLDQLMDNTGVINFVLAFRYPLYGIDATGALSAFYDTKYVESIRSFSTEYKLEKIKEYLDYNSMLVLDANRKAAYDKLISDLKAHIHAISGQITPSGDWRKTEPVIDPANRESIKRFLLRLESLDITFRVAAGTTANMLSEAAVEQYDETTRECTDYDWYTYHCTPGKPFTFQLARSTIVITPDHYVQKISQGTIVRFAAIQVLNLFDFDISTEQQNAIINLVTYLPIWTRDRTAGYANIYGALSTIFSLRLDNMAGLNEGTIKALIQDPGNAYNILLPQAARYLDERLGLDSTSKWSLVNLYHNYQNRYAVPTRGTESKKDECIYPTAEMATLNQREKAAKTWVNTHGRYEDIGQATVENTSYFVVAYANNIENEPEYDAMLDELQNIKEERERLDNEYNQCKVSHRDGGASIDGSIIDQARAAVGRFNWNQALEAVIDTVSQTLHDKIREATRFTIDMPAEDIRHFFENGDMRYFNAAITAYTANTFLDEINPDNSIAVPASMQISYAMIKLWFMGSPEAEDYAADAAAANYFRGDAALIYEDARVPNAIGDVYEGGVAGTLTTNNYYVNHNSDGTYTSYPASPALDETSLVNFSQTQSNVEYGTFDRAAVPGMIAGSVDDANYCTSYRATTIASQSGANLEEKTNNAYNSTTPDPADPAYTVGDVMGACDDIIEYNDNLAAVRATARENVRDRFRTQTQYRMYDAMFWTKDKGVYPGFSYALFEGTAAERNHAIGTYLKNCIRNGEIMGHEIAWLRTIGNYDMWEAIYKYVIDLNAGEESSDILLANFEKSGALNYLAGYIEEQSEKAFGFHLDIDYAKALIVGFSTGDWGLRFTNPNHKFVDASGTERTFATVGGVFATETKAYLYNHAFTWADEQLGWSSGTAKTVYDSAKTLYDVTMTLRKIKQYESLLTKASNQAAAMKTAGATAEQIKNASAVREYTTYCDNNPELVENIHKHGSPQAAKQANKDLAAGMVLALVNAAITKWINKAFGEKISKWEEKVGLVQGSTMVLINAGVSVGTAAAAHSMNLVGAKLVSQAVIGAYIAIAIFIAMNLFMVYKIEVKCSADGYYPVMQTPSSNYVLDADSDLGVWDGKNNSIAAAKSVAAAQYKARRLIYDTLEMHNNPLYKDIYPSQIMTGREEDVTATNDSVATNMCAVLDPDMVSIAGICGGNTRAGVWSNPQTTGYTHIGF